MELRTFLKPGSLWVMELHLTWGLWEWFNIYISKLPHQRGKRAGYKCTNSYGPLVAADARVLITLHFNLSCCGKDSSAGNAGVGSWHALK